MSKNLFSRYIWIVDTIRRYGSITREELNRLWMQSEFSDGEPLARRTFYTYRNAIEDLFKISIVCNQSTFEYSIADQGGQHAENVTDWMLNTASMSNTLTDAHSIADRIFLEDVPSARQHLSGIVGAMKSCRVIRFGYSAYWRTGAPKPVTLEPYFLKIFRLRWYITGRNVAEDVIKTYALDRISDLVITADSFTIPSTFDAEAYFRDAFGIVFSHGEPKKVILKVTSRQAKYFRALPLHHSQTEMVGDSFSIFTYRLRLTPDLVQELLSYGPAVTVVAPAELRAMMVSSLRETMANYENDMSVLADNIN